jgi:hypothetical protein
MYPFYASDYSISGGDFPEEVYPPATAAGQIRGIPAEDPAVNKKRPETKKGEALSGLPFTISACRD